MRESTLNRIFNKFDLCCIRLARLPLLYSIICAAGVMIITSFLLITLLVIITLIISLMNWGFVLVGILGIITLTVAYTIYMFVTS